MKKILGLDLGNTSIGWALVQEAEATNEQSDIIKMGVRVIPLTTDEKSNFEKGKAQTTNQDRTSKRAARRNLQRYKLRRKELLKVLKENHIINDKSLLTEDGKNTTFQTLELRAKAAVERIELEDLARVFISINKKRGYKSSRKAKSDDEGELIDGMKVAKMLHNRKITPGQFASELLAQEKKFIPSFYRSDLQSEFEKIWQTQREFYPDILTQEFKDSLENKGKTATASIFKSKYSIYTADNKGADKKTQAYNWRSKAVNYQLPIEVVAYVLAEINGYISKSSGYLGAISDRSKELYFNNQTVGQYMWEQIKKDPHCRLKGQVFYRKDYEDEFDTIWKEQSKHHQVLTPELKELIKDVIIFYQRRLKSQKGLISICELEGKKKRINVDGKVKEKITGPRVCPKSSPLYQEFRIWQKINDIIVWDKSNPGEKWRLDEEERSTLFKELSIRDRLSKAAILKLLYKNPRSLEMNFSEITGNRTFSKLLDEFQKIVELSGHGEHVFSKMSKDEIIELLQGVFDTLGIDSNILKFDSRGDNTPPENHPFYQLWHLLYSYEGDNSNTGSQSLARILQKNYGFDEVGAQLLSQVTFEPDYGSMSSKAIKKILPFLKEGHDYSKACELAGYNHSKSYTNEERSAMPLKDFLEILPKNSLRNPVVEKIINQAIHVVNTIIKKYGKPDEIRVELARELKKNAAERAEMTKRISDASRVHDKIRKELTTTFGLPYVSRNDLIRYKLWKELEPRGYKTLYTNTYIAPDKLFSKEFDIEHIIPQSRLFDDSLANKTLETRAANIEKGNRTALDYIRDIYGESGVAKYRNRIEDWEKNENKDFPVSRAKVKKLLMSEADIPDGFIDRDLRDSQYIAKKTREILQEICHKVHATTGVVTDRLREDWQLLHVLQELNWEKYDKLGLTYYETNKDGQKLPRIKDWTKRNDHRHHAMDALVVAFTKQSHVQYLNNLNARSEKDGITYGIEKKELFRDERGKLLFKPPLPIERLRSRAKEELEKILVSYKAKNKVVTPSKNKIKTKNGYKIQHTLTPRGQLHNESIYGSIQQFKTTEVKVGGNFDVETINKVAKKKHREALLERLNEFGGDPKKAFTGKNSLAKNPIYLDALQTSQVPEKVKLVEQETVYTIRKAIDPLLNVEKVIDPKVKKILMDRLKVYKGNAKEAFSNLDENPIWLNETKGIKIKSVRIRGVANAIPLHEKRDHTGDLIINNNGKEQPVDYINTGNNHHVAIYRDQDGNLQENVVSFFEALARVNANLPIVDKEFNSEKGWQFVTTLKQNEYFIFPDENSDTIVFENLVTEDSLSHISQNLFRVQKISSKNYVFNHHQETTSIDGTYLKNYKELSGITYHFIQTPSKLKGIMKVRINHIGEIVKTDE